MLFYVLQTVGKTRVRSIAKRKRESQISVILFRNWTLDSGFSFGSFPGAKTSWKHGCGRIIASFALVAVQWHPKQPRKTVQFFWPEIIVNQKSIISLHSVFFALEQEIHLRVHSSKNQTRHFFPVVYDETHQCFILLCIWMFNLTFLCLDW